MTAVDQLAGLPTEPTEPSMALELQQVAELVLGYVTDARCLLACSMLTHHMQQCTQLTVQLRLQLLIEACSLTSPDTAAADTACLAWLCRLAGPVAVNSHALGCALLDKVMQVPESVIPLLQATGLKLTNHLVVHMAQQRMQLMPAVLETFAKQNLPGCADCTYLRLVRNMSRWFAKFGSESHGEQKHFLAQVTADNLLDMLLLTVNLAQISQLAASRTAVALLVLDQQKLHVLQPPDNAEPSSSLGDAEGMPTPAGRAGERHQVAAVVAQLLENCVVYRLYSLCERVAALPAAQSIGTAQVTKLLYLAVLQRQDHDGAVRAAADLVGTLATLPAAQTVPTDCIYTLLMHCIGMGYRCKAAEHLLKLPGVKQVTSEQLCQLIKEAGHKYEQEKMVQTLGRLADGRQLERQAVLQLLKGCILHPWFSRSYGSSYDSTFSKCLKWMSTLQPGRHIQGDDVLELLELSAVWNRESWTSIPLLRPAVEEVQDVPRFVACIKTAVGFRGQFGKERLREMIGRVLQEMPISQQLQLSDWGEILQSTLQPLNSMLVSCDKFPVLQQMTPQDLGQMLQLAAGSGCGPAVLQLCSVPAAQQLQPAVLCDVLLQLLPHKRNAYDGPPLPHIRADAHLREVAQLDIAIEALLALLAAAQMSPTAAQQLLHSALDLGMLAVAQMIQKQLPQAAQMAIAPGSEQLLTLVKHALGWCEPAAVLQLLQQPRWQQQLGPAEVKAMLQDALLSYCTCTKGGWCNSRGVCFRLPVLGKVYQELQHLSALQQVNAEGVLQLVASGINSGASNMVASLVALPAAAGIPPSQLLELLQSKFKRINELGAWEVLLNMPAAQQFNGQDVGMMLQCCVEHKYSRHDDFVPHEVLENLVQLLPVERVDGCVVQRLVATCMRREWVQAAQVLLAKLPTAQHLSAVQVRHLVQLSAPKTAELRKTQIRAALLALPGTQAAVGGDPCLRAVVDALKVLDQPHQEPLMDGVRSARVAYGFDFPASDSD